MQTETSPKAGERTQLEIVALSDIGDTKWWPDLYLRKGRKLRQIQPEQCGLVMDVFKGDRGFSEMPKSSIDLFNVTGEKIGHIGYNGRVWLNDIEGDVEIPVEGVATAAQRESEGWK